MHSFQHAAGNTQLRSRFSTELDLARLVGINVPLMLSIVKHVVSRQKQKSSSNSRLILALSVAWSHFGSWACF